MRGFPSAIDSKESRYRNTNHCISKEIVASAEPAARLPILRPDASAQTG
jgi:hypothetical protein